MQQIDGRTRTCGLIGNPVEHTMSPVIHNTLAQREGRNMVYVPFPVEEGCLAAAIKGAYALNILGLNVTVPYKSEAAEYLTEKDEMAGRIGAVNTLVRTGEGYKGYNTDMLGLFRAMQSEKIRLEGEAILILGAGGAARAVAYMCVLKGAAKVYLLNRTLHKAEAVAAEINRAFAASCVIPLRMGDYPLLEGGRKYLAIQATSVGLYPDTEEAVIMDKAFYKRIHTGYDLIYNPQNTRFMSLVREAGGKAYHGLKMLLYQGVIAYELWNDVKISEEEALFVYNRMKEAMGIKDE